MAIPCNKSQKNNTDTFWFHPSGAGAHVPLSRDEVQGVRAGQACTPGLPACRRASLKSAPTDDVSVGPVRY